MREMKDSGIEWIGEIYNKLSVSRVGLYYDIILGKMLCTYPLEKMREYPYYCAANVHFDGIDNNNLKTMFFSDYEIEQYQVRKGDLLVVEGGAGAGGCSIVGNVTSIIGIQNSIMIVRGRKNLSDARFIGYVIQLLVKRGYIDFVCNKATIPHFTKEKLAAVPFPLWDYDSQFRIADYLDNKFEEINSVITDIQSQIEILEEYKRSVITEAVTKGLDPDVEMRDSGVQWIGMIPKHWKVDNPKWHFVQRKDRATKGLTQLTASQKYGVVTQEEYMEITGAKVVTVEKDFDILKLVCPGDFIIHMRSFQGGLEYSEKYGSISSAYVMLIPQKTILEPRFYKWFFKSPVYIDALSSTSNLIRDGQAMRYANFIQLPIPLMPKEEQQQIADYLDSKCAEIDSIIAEKKQQIETIEEYKKSLIFEYVTGKKEVTQ